jgi:transposase InsO family protein
MVGADICEVKGQNYLAVIDYYSRYLEKLFLSSLTSEELIVKFKSIFALHGIPETLVTDNGRQFISREFQKFSKEWNFQHITCSPYFPQSKRESERAVQEARRF